MHARTFYYETQEEILFTSVTPCKRKRAFTDVDMEGLFVKAALRRAPSTGTSVRGRILLSGPFDGLV